MQCKVLALCSSDLLASCCTRPAINDNSTCSCPNCLPTYTLVSSKPSLHQGCSSTRNTPSSAAPASNPNPADFSICRATRRSARPEKPRATPPGLAPPGAVALTATTITLGACPGTLMVCTALPNAWATCT